MAKSTEKIKEQLATAEARAENLRKELKDAETKSKAQQGRQAMKDYKVLASAKEVLTRVAPELVGPVDKVLTILQVQAEGFGTESK